MDSTGFHMECRHIHLGFHGTVQFHGAGIPEKQSYLVTKNSSNIMNTLYSMMCHMIDQKRTPSTELCSCYKTRNKLNKSCYSSATHKSRVGKL